MADFVVVFVVYSSKSEMAYSNTHLPSTQQLIFIDSLD